MALIGQIRKNSWILIVMMALASLGVIIMYMSDDRTSLFGGSQFTMGKVNGEKIDWRNFSRVEDVMYRNSSADPYDRRAEAHQRPGRDELTAPVLRERRRCCRY